MTYKIQPITISDTTYDVTVGQDGMFYADFGTATITARSYQDLTEKLKTAVRTEKIKVAVPFTRIRKLDYNTRLKVIEHGTATGIHGGSGNVLYTIDGVKGSQQDHYGTTVLDRLTDDDTDKLHRLLAAQEAADSAVTRFMNDHSMNLKAAVKAAVEAAREEGK